MEDGDVGVEEMVGIERVLDEVDGGIDEAVCGAVGDEEEVEVVAGEGGKSGGDDGGLEIEFGGFMVGPEREEDDGEDG